MTPHMICVCTPSLGAVPIFWARAMAEMMKVNNTAMRFNPVLDTKGDEIAECRNKAVAECLELERKHNVHVSHFFWVDDDVIPTRAALLQLYSRQRPIVSGVYFTKCTPGLPLIYPGRAQGVAEFVPDEAIEAWGHGMGLCLVQADVYRKMLAAGLPLDKYGRPGWYKTNREYTVQDAMLDCGGTEDLHFLNRAGELGYTPLVDCTKHAFGWHFDMARQKGYPEKQFGQWSAGKPVVWETSRGTFTWE